MHTITRKFGFDTGHRVLRHESKCRYLHGHRYSAEVSIRSPELDKIGRVLDFGQVKTVVGDWIDANWDHNLVLHPDDPILRMLPGPMLNVVTGGRNPFALYLSSKAVNPTVENMVAVLAHTVDALLGPIDRHLRCHHVRLYETPNCLSDYAVTGSRAMLSISGRLCKSSK